MTPFQEQLSLILELQEIDLRLHRFRSALDALPHQMKEAEEAYLSAKVELEGAEAELASVERERRDDESELAASVEHLRAREAKLYAIKTNKEYQAALKEVSEGRRLNKEREERILQAMERAESLTKKITQLRQGYADKEVVWRTKQDEAKREEGRIRGEMEGDGNRRPALAARLDKAILRRYEFIRQRYAQAVAYVARGICQGCSTRVPPQLFNEMLRRTELKSCPNCQRLIYVEEAAGEQPAD